MRGLNSLFDLSCCAREGMCVATARLALMLHKFSFTYKRHLPHCSSSLPARPHVERPQANLL